MADVLLTTTELVDGVEITGTAATIATTEGAAGDPVGTAAAAVAAHVADTTDAHALAGITGLTAALAGKADDADVTALDGRLDILEAVNPVLTINGDPPDVDGNVDIAAGGGAVDSVNGQTGVVVLDASDVGADASGDAATAQAAAEATAAGALSAHAADTTSVHGIADTSALALTGDAPTAHAASHQDGGTDELALDGSQITSGTVADARIASTIARDSEVTSAISAHEADTTNVHGITDTSALVTTSTVAELARDALGSALTAGTGITITPDDAADTITISASGGSGGTVVWARKQRTAGNVAMTSTNWTAVDTGLDITLAAAAGDLVRFEVAGGYQNQATFIDMDVFTMVSGSPVHSITSGAALDNGHGGNYGWFAAQASVYTAISGGQSYVLQSSDISGGTVTLRLMCRLQTSGSRTIFGVAAEMLVVAAWVFPA